MGKLDGKVALITGAGNGLGRAAATLFAAEGARIAVAEISDASGARTVDEVVKLGGDARLIHTDVMDADSVEACIKHTADLFGRLDVLYNNAGGSSPEDGPVATASLSAFQRAVTLNLTSVWLCCHYGLPLMIASGGGSVITTSSSSAINFHAGSRHAYGTAKGGVISLTKAIAFDYAKHGIRANVIAPGPTDSERVAATFAASSVLMEKIKAYRPLGAGQPINVAHLALYLACEDSAYTTGQVFSVNNEVMG